MTSASRDGLLKRDEFVLVVVDVQERLANVMTHRDRIVGAARRLLHFAALVNAPVVVTRQYPAGLGATVPEVEELLKEIAAAGTRVISVDKTAFCCAEEPSFVEALELLGRRQVVVAGMETHICVMQTALALTEAGFDLHVVEDACCSRDDHAHLVGIERLRHAGVTVSLSESVMYEAVGRAGTDEFKRLLEIVKSAHG